MLPAEFDEQMVEIRSEAVKTIMLELMEDLRVALEMLAESQREVARLKSRLS